MFWYLLHVQKGEGDCFPKVITIFTSDFEVFIPFLFDQWIVLNGHRVPHIVFLKKRRKKIMKEIEHVLLYINLSASTN